MSRQVSDLTFFTNDKTHTLLDRFKATLVDTRLFDVLVGYFRSSGFYQLYDSIKPVEKTRILVGLGLDETSVRAVEGYIGQFRPEDRDYGFVITGFSNFFYSGLAGNREFKDKAFRSCQKFTDADEAFLDGVRSMIAQGLIAKKIAQTIKKAFEKTLDPLEMLGVLRQHIRTVEENTGRPTRASGSRREIILSSYQIADSSTD